MADSLEPLILDLLEWIAPRPRPYSEVMEAWSTSCPQLPIWEEANERGFVVREHAGGRGTFVAVTPAGREFLGSRRPEATGSGRA